MTFRRFAVLGLALLALAAQPASGDARMQAVMRSKLANTQSLLKAIVTADYREIDRAALALSRISEMEIVSWQNPPKPDYTGQAVLFMTSVDGLREAARRRDMEAVGAEYDAGVTVYHCHRPARCTGGLVDVPPFQLVRGRPTADRLGSSRSTDLVFETAMGRGWSAAEREDSPVVFKPSAPFIYRVVRAVFRAVAAAPGSANIPEKPELIARENVREDSCRWTKSSETGTTSIQPIFNALPPKVEPSTRAWVSCGKRLPP